MKKGLKRFVNTYLSVAFCFFLGMSPIVIFAAICDFALNTHFMLMWKAAQWPWMLLMFGFLGVAWAIREGEFIDHIKTSHWTQRDKNETQ